MCRLIGEANEGNIFVDDEQITALIDSGAQVTTINVGLVQKLGIPIRPLKTILHISATGGSLVPYLGYVEVNLKFPGIAAFDEDVLMMVIEDDEYGDRVPVQVGTLHIDRAIELITEEEYNKMGTEWKRTRISRYMGSKSARVSKEKVFTLDQVKGPVKLTKKLKIGPFDTVKVPGLTKVRNHDGRVNAIVESSIEGGHSGILAVPTYTHLKSGSSKVQICLQNLSCRSITLKAKTIVAEVSAANAIPKSFAPRYVDGIENIQEEQIINSEGDVQNEPPTSIKEEIDDKPMVIDRPPLDKEKFTKLMTKVDLSGKSHWTTEQQGKAENTISKYGFLFALDDLDLGKTSVVKHHITLTDYVPFKERYRRIPPHQFEEVRKHLQEMLEIGAIRKSNSPWASAVVLVRKKDGSLRFCIDLRKLNAKTVRDAYGLPRIDEALGLFEWCVYLYLFGFKVRILASGIR